MAERRKTGRLERLVSVRLAQDEEALIREEADRRGVSVSNLMRLAAIRECRPSLRVDDSPSSFTASTYSHDSSADTATRGSTARTTTFIVSSKT